MANTMRYLVIGLGSMGKRRIRNLQSLGVSDIAGLDPRADRRNEASIKYGVTAYETLALALSNFGPQVYIISTPPNNHMEYAYDGYQRGIHCFIEASVVDADRILALSSLLPAKGLVMVPSCTMSFYPGPKKIKELLADKSIGQVLNINYQTGQYLPDWHPWENIQDFYVSQRNTGGAREIVPFELTWLTDIFGPATALSCFKAKLSDLPVDIDDTYHCILRFNTSGAILNLTVEVISQPEATREMRIIGSDGIITFSGARNMVSHISKYNQNWSTFEFATGTLENNYINPEEPYIDEIKCFLKAVQAGDASLFPNSLAADSSILLTLDALEQLAG